jgi:hypothetical protein
MRIDTVGLMTPGDLGQALAVPIKTRGLTACIALDRRSERSRSWLRD